MDNPSHWLAIARLDQSFNPQPVTLVLDEQQITHRFRREDKALLLEIEDPYQRALALSILQRFAPAPHAPQYTQLAMPKSLGQLAKDNPVVLACLLLSIAGALLVEFKFEWIHWFTYLDYQLVGDQIFYITAEQSFQQGQYWRLLTPAFLHFGVFHVVFNSLWLWELGRRIEKLAGSFQLLVVVVSTAVISNIAQYQFEGPSLFGGLSGVVYGLLGYVWLRNRTAPDPLLNIAPGILVLMIGWLLLCMTGLVNILISGQVANAAHVGGLLSGIVLGYCSGRFSQKSSS